MSSSRHALRVLVHFHGAVVEDKVLPARAGAFTLDDDDVGIGVPPPADATTLVTLAWTGPGSVQAKLADGSERTIAPDAPLEFDDGLVRVTLMLVPLFRVAPPALAGDLGLVAALAAMLTLSVVVHNLLELLEPPAAMVAVGTSPEVIARLLQHDYEGADEGYLAELRERPEASVRAHDIYLPAGDRGPLDKLSGAAAQRDRKQAGEPDEVAEPPRFQPLRPDREVADLGQPAELPTIDGVTEPRRVADQGLGSDASQKRQVASHDKEGWGLRDWYDVEAETADAEDIKQHLEFAREQVRIDPDSSWALQQLAYYQYLAQDYESCRKTYDRFIQLNPDNPLGYNNLALVYKRLGEYDKEEGYYRLALALEPGDTHALNNLAVNLGHQKRFDEALSIMEDLQQLEPDDPYADLHRSKIYAAKGDEQQALRFLEKALAGMARLDTLHHIEFRQDIRVDPAFELLREKPVFNEILVRYYGREAAPTGRGAVLGGGHG